MTACEEEQTYTPGVESIARGLETLLGSVPVLNGGIGFVERDDDLMEVSLGRVGERGRRFWASVSYTAYCVEFAAYNLSLKCYYPPEVFGYFQSGNDELYGYYSFISRGQIWSWLTQMIADPNEVYDPHKTLIGNRSWLDVPEDKPARRLSEATLRPIGRRRLLECRRILRGVGEPLEKLIGLEERIG